MILCPLDDPENPEFAGDDARKAFLRALDANPDDHTTRAVYCDWLTDHGHYAEAERQREWVAAKKWIEGYVGKHGGNYGDVPDAGYTPDDAALGDVGWGKYEETTIPDALQAGRERKAGGYPIYVQIGSDSLRDHFHGGGTPGENAREFWKAWAVLTAEEPPEKPEDENPFACSC